MIKQIVSLALALFLSLTPFTTEKPVEPTPETPVVMTMELLPPTWG